MNSILISFAAIAALIHFFFFVLESILWVRPMARKIFRLSEADAETTKLLAFNQGFYNLFLTAAVMIGLVGGEPTKILIDYAMASMIGAGLVLFFSKKNMLRGALIQAGFPILYFVCGFFLAHPPYLK